MKPAAPVTKNFIQQSPDDERRVRNPAATTLLVSPECCSMMFLSCRTESLQDFVNPLLRISAPLDDGFRREIRIFWTPFGIAAVNEDRCAPRRLSGPDVSPTVADHTAQLKVNSKSPAAFVSRPGLGLRQCQASSSSWVQILTSSSLSSRRPNHSIWRDPKSPRPLGRRLVGWLHQGSPSHRVSVEEKDFPFAQSLD